MTAFKPPMNSVVTVLQPVVIASMLLGAHSIPVSAVMVSLQPVMTAVVPALEPIVLIRMFGIPLAVPAAFMCHSGRC